MPGCGAVRKLLCRQVSSEWLMGSYAFDAACSHVASRCYEQGPTRARLHGKYARAVVSGPGCLA